MLDTVDRGLDDIRCCKDDCSFLQSFSSHTYLHNCVESHFGDILDWSSFHRSKYKKSEPWVPRSGKQDIASPHRCHQLERQVSEPIS